MAMIHNQQRFYLDREYSAMWWWRGCALQSQQCWRIRRTAILSAKQLLFRILLNKFFTSKPRSPMKTHHNHQRWCIAPSCPNNTL
jgi:hypothetical protein